MRILDHVDVILCVFGHLSATSFDLVLTEHALDVTVSAQKSRARVLNALKKRANDYEMDNSVTCTET